MPWDVVVVGGANTDYLVRGPRLPKPGETVQGEEFQEAPGGKGANQAVAAARLGARVALVARVGPDERGERLVRSLRDEGVDTSQVSRDPQAPTGAAIISVDARGEKQILVAPGANAHVSPLQIEAAAGVIAAAKVVLVQLEVPLPTVSVAIGLAHDAGAKVVLDPAPAVPLPEDLLDGLYLIRPNASEAEVLTRERVSDLASARRAASVLLKSGVGAVAVQAGGEGNLLVWRGGELFIPKIDLRSVDATGAGDAFAAALAVAAAEGMSLDEAGWMASVAAALATTKVGAQAGLPRRDEVLALLAGRTAEHADPV